MDYLMPMPLLIGAILLAAGIVLYLFPPKKINYFYGYRTGNSMKSQQRWDFAQRYSAIALIKGGCFLMISSILGFELKGLSLEHYENALGLGLMLFTAAIIILSTEIALKSKFKNSNKDIA